MTEPTASEHRRAATTCDPAARVTRSLLGYGVIAGPFYVLVSLAQAVVRDGFDLRRHQWSLLANGDFGWIQTANLIATGAMCLAFAVGVRRALRPGHHGSHGQGGIWVPRLVTLFGLGMVGGGVFRADPALGFPPGTPDGPGEVSWHGTLHFGSAGIGFISLIVACFVLARRFAADGHRDWAAYSRTTGVTFLLGFGAVAAGGGSTATILAFTAAALFTFGWLSATAVHLYRRVTG